MTPFLNRFARMALLGSIAFAPTMAMAQATAPAMVAQSDPMAMFDLLPLQPSGGSGAFLAGQQALDDLRTDEAARYFNAAAQADRDNPLLVERAFIALAADGQMERAVDAARHLLELEPVNELAEMTLATQALKDNDYAGAEHLLDKVGQGSFTGLTATILRAWALVGENRKADADAALDSLSRAGLDDFLVFHRALMAEAAGETDEAIELAGQAFEAEPYIARMTEVYARMLANADRFDEALDVIAQFENQGLSHPVVTLVKQKIEAGEHPGAFATSPQIGAAEMFHGIGAALSRDGSFDLALVFLRLAAYLDPSGDVIALTLGQLLDSADQHDAANAIYDAIPLTSPMKPTAVVRVAQNLDAKGQRPEALRRLRNIVNSRPQDIDAVSVLGDLLRYDEQYLPAAEAYTKALELTGGESPSDWRFYYVRGIAYERAKDWPKAEADLKKALELNPDQPSVLNYLGYSWIDMDKNLEPALEMIEKAVEAQPQDGYIVDSLGWAFYKLGRMDEAVETLERAVMLRPNDAELNDHLGDAYWADGRHLEAHFQWRIAAFVDEIGDVRERIAKKIAEIDAGETPESMEEAGSDATETAEAVLPAEPALGADAGDDEEYVVRRGDNLWTIARERYGSGAAYQLLVDANRDNLTNPDLIHPGLRLVLPQRP